jgi:hypothetical protein
MRRGFAPDFVIYKKGCTRLAAASDKVCQWLATSRWFSSGILVSSSNKADHHDITKTLYCVDIIYQYTTITCLVLNVTFIIWQQQNHSTVVLIWEIWCQVWHVFSEQQYHDYTNTTCQTWHHISQISTTVEWFCCCHIINVTFKTKHKCSISR